MSKPRYDSIRKEIELVREMERYIRSNAVCNEREIHDWRRKVIREIREKLARIDRDFPDPLVKPITEDWRRVYSDEYGEDGYDFRILKAEGWTDEEIEDYIMSEVGYPPICSPYDCTGKRFTSWTSWSKQPCGIVMIHSFGLDV